DLLKREEIVDSYFSNGAALVSPLKTDTNETIITIVILNKSVKWGNNKVRLICMVNNENTFNRNLMRFYEIISVVLSNAQFVNQIIKDKSFETFMRIFKMVENDLLTN
ncbi:MAG: PTS sugar transporter subunit IIA, partial [Erysipelothrix sp.]|nr:PTS sugar transporter subunit IIA [Erysipelothrix sp.]